MGSSSGGKVAGYRYKMGLHFGICQGPIDRLRSIIVGERIAWQGGKTDNASFRVQAPQLFGGDEREGGIAGDAVAMFGSNTQTLPGAVAALLPSPSPAFRGVFTLAYDGLIGSNNPYIKPFAFKVQRTKAGWNGGTWLPAKCEIGALGAETFPLTVLQSRFAGGDATDESGFLNGAPTQSGGTITSDGFHVNSDNTATPSTPSTLTYDWPGFGGAGVGPLTLEFFITWEQTPNIDYTPCVRLVTDTTNVSGTVQDFGFTGGSGAMTYNDAGFGIEYTGTVTPSFPVHCAVVLDGADKRVYIGGTRVHNATGAIPPGVNPMRLILGDPAGYTSGYTKFSISGFRVRREALYSGASITPPTSIPDPDAAGAQTGNVAMNPAHIIYQCLTDPVWGMGYPTATIGPTFEAAANALYAEGFGLCLLWNKQEELGAFIRIVLDHIGGVLYADPKTGLFELKLLRADYDPGTLPVFGPAEIREVESFQRVGYGETINEITVVFRDVETNKDTPVTVQNLANVQAQGAVVSATRQYPGLPSSDLALRVAQRDLIASSTPLAKARITMNREAWSLVPGAVFKLTFPKLGLSSVVMRVLDIDYGALADGTISVEIAEDVFGLPASSYAAQEPIGWVEADHVPAPIAHQEIIEAPYRGLVGAMTAAELAAVDEDSAYLCALAARPSDTATGFSIYSRVGAAEFLRRGAGSFVPWGELNASITCTDTAIVLATGTIDLDAVVLGSLAIVGTGAAAEWVRVDAINIGTRTLTVARGMLDTVPALHSAGDAVWMGDGSLGIEGIERVTAEEVDFQLLTRDGLGSLPLGEAMTISLAGDQRQARPYPPGNLKINSATYPASASGALTITWAHRDRQQQTADFIAQTASSIGPETGVTYSAELRNASNVVIASVSGLTGTTWSPTITQGGTYDATVRLWSVRGGLESWQVHDYTFSYTSAGVSIGAAGKTFTATASLVFPAAGAAIALALTQTAQAARAASGWRSTITLQNIGGGSLVGVGSVLTAQFTRYYTVGPDLFGDVEQAGITFSTARTRAQALGDWATIANLNSVLRARGWNIYLDGSDANPSVQLFGPIGEEWDVYPTPAGTPPNSIFFGLEQSIATRGGPAIVSDRPQIVTATLTGTPNPGDLYTVTLNGVDYTYTALTTDDLAGVAYGMAAVINAASAFNATSAAGVITINGILASNVYTYSGSASGAHAYGQVGADAFWTSTTFLLNTLGADNSTTFTDASTLGHTITTNGGAKVTSSQLDADGTGDFLSAPGHTGFDFGSGDFAVEAIAAVRNNPGTGPRPIIARWKNGTNQLAFFLGIDNSNKLVFYYSTDGNTGVFTPVTSSSITVGTTPQHFLANRISGTLRLFIAGVKLYEATHSGTIFVPTSTPLTIAGVDYSSTSSHTDLIGRHRTFRVTKGSGRGYTANFTPPTGPFANY